MYCRFSSPSGERMIFRRPRLFTSSVSLMSGFERSMPETFPRWMWASTSATSRLWAELTAWKSPVKWMLTLSEGVSQPYRHGGLAAPEGRRSRGRSHHNQLPAPLPRGEAMVDLGDVLAVET